MSEAPGVVVTLSEIFKKVQDTDAKVDKLATAVGEMVAINRRLDQHHDRLNDHGTRLGTVETVQAIQKATQRPRAPWYVVVGAVVGILGGTATLIGLLAVLGEISRTLGG